MSGQGPPFSIFNDQRLPSQVTAVAFIWDFHHTLGSYELLNGRACEQAGSEFDHAVTPEQPIELRMSINGQSLVAQRLARRSLKPGGMVDSGEVSMIIIYICQSPKSIDLRYGINYSIQSSLLCILWRQRMRTPTLGPPSASTLRQVA